MKKEKDVKKQRSARLEDDGKTLVLTIDGKETRYALHKHDPTPSVAYVAYRLTKEDGTAYDVFLDRFGMHCDCPSSLKSNRGPCKHCLSLRKLGLLVKPKDGE